VYIECKFGFVKKVGIRWSLTKASIISVEIWTPGNNYFT
jgi:hypothetical protein